MCLRIETIVYIMCTGAQTGVQTHKCTDNTDRHKGFCVSYAMSRHSDERFMICALFPIHVCMFTREKKKMIGCVVESRLDKTKSKTYANHRKCMKKSKR